MKRPRRHPEPARSARRGPGAVVLAILAPFLTAAALHSGALGEDGAASPAGPVAECRVVTLPAAEPEPEMMNGLIMAVEDDPLDDYQAHRPQLDGGLLDGHTDGSDATLRLVLEGPFGMRRVDLEVLIDGESFRRSREIWIDAILQGIDEPAPEDEPAVDEPAEEGAAESEEETDVDPVASVVDVNNEVPVGEAAAEAPPEESNENQEGDSDAELESGDADEAVAEAEQGGEDQPDEAPNDEAEEEAAVPLVATRARREPTLRDRLNAYVAAVGGDVDREEVDWLLQRWSSGSEIALLSAGRSWERLRAAPLLRLLDGDNDGGLSEREIAAINQRFRRADIDENGIVELAEVRARLPRQRRRRRQRARKPLVRIQTERDTSPADLSIRVEFTSSGDGKLTLTSIGEPAGAASPPEVVAREEVVSVNFRPDYYEVAAIQPANAAEVSAQSEHPEQLAIGAVVDGFPLWRLLDIDDDKRLTGRERRALPALLSSFDLNGDGDVDAKEIPTAIRVVVGRGPVVHELLDSPAAAARNQPLPPDVRAPEWFLSMDLNRDGELSRDEFAGTREQFESLDADGNGVLTAREAGGEAESDDDDDSLPELEQDVSPDDEFARGPSYPAEGFTEPA